MNKDINNIFTKYRIIKESEDISNNMSGKDVSTKYNVDHTAKFLPIGQDIDDEEKKKFEDTEKIQNELKILFDGLKNLITNCEGKNITSKSVSKLISTLDSPEIKKHLNNLLNHLQLKEQDQGLNSFASY